MTPDEWSLVKRILADALECPPAERSGYLDQACGGDAELRRRVDALIEADEREWDLMEAPAAVALSVAADLHLPASGDRIGAYEILREIGRGGMGVVYLARRADDQFQKIVAIKLSRFGVGEALHKRFRAERQIVATLDHPNVARLLDGGTTGDGRPYFVMEHVEGQPLVAWCDARAKSFRERLEIFLDVCAAVESAHAQGVIHRDLKPTNILVTNDGVVKLLDFGIAKLLAPAELGVSLEDSGASIGLMTPEYASPEQLRGEAMTAASDVYALGVVLYELVVGRRPHLETTSSPAALIRAICETEAPRASTVAPPQVGKLLLGDLDTVLAKALRKEPERRYGSARELADDIRRFLEGRPVGARPDTWGYRSWKFASRHRGAVGAAAVAAASLLAALSVFWTERQGTERVRPPPPVLARSLVVLPFKDLSGATGNPVLELGMADTLITKLSTVSGISVRPMAAVSALASEGGAGGERDPVQVGRALRADAVVVGALQQLNGRSRVTVRLVRVADGHTIWGDVFDTVDTDVFTVEDAIARRVAEGLVPHLSPEARERLGRRGTENLDAYQEYLKGRYFWSRRTESDFRKAIHHFEQAIAADDHYALAHAGLADCYSLLSVWGAGPPRETLGRARVAAGRAVALDDAPGEAHASSAFVKWVYDWDWAGADAAFRRAITFSPNYATVHQWYAYYLASRGRFDEAIAEIRRAQQLDPLSVSIATDLGEIHCWAGRYDEAIAHLKAALDLEPNFSLAHNVLGITYLKQGRVTDALAELERAVALDGSPRMISSLGYGYGVAHRGDDARRARDRLLALSKERYISPFTLALVSVGLGENDQAFALLDRAFRDRSDTMAILEVHPLMEGLRGDPRFAALMARVNSSQNR